MLVAQIHHLLDYLVVVVLVAAVAPAVVGAPHLLAETSVVGVGNERPIRRIGQSEHPSCHLAFFGFCLGRGNHILWQSGKVCFVGDVKNKVIVVCQHVAVHLLRQFSQPLAVLRKSLARLSRQVHAVPHKSIVCVLQQCALLRGQFQVFPLLVHRFHPLKQVLVHIHTVRKTRQLRRQLHHNVLQLTVGVAFVQVEQHAADAVQLFAGRLQRHNGVLKSRRGLLFDYVLNILFGFLYRLPYGGNIMFIAYLAERRCLVGSLPFLQQRVCGLPQRGLNCANDCHQKYGFCNFSHLF